MKKILLVGLHDDDNLGDAIISDCTIALLNKILGDLDIERLSLNEKNKLVKSNPVIFFISRCLSRLALYAGCFERLKHYIELWYLLSLIKKSLSGFEAIVIGGGGLIKHKHQFFGTLMLAVTECAEKLQIPIYYNSVGVEGFKDDWKCGVLKHCLNNPVVKLISTRDDIDTLKSYYVDKKNLNKTIAVCDPAVWASEVYDINKEKQPINKKKSIGINISYGNLFLNYGIDLNASKHYRLMYDIVTHLYREYSLTLYTNGGSSDNEFMLKLYNQLCQEGYNIMCEIPNEAKDLVRIISKFDCILATRLHSSIVAYSLNVPSVPMEWNNKVKFFCDVTHNDMFVDCNNFTCNYIVGMLNRALRNGYDQTLRNEYRETIIKYVQRINI